MAAPSLQSLPGNNFASPRPTCTILGGTNGSGKSSIYRVLNPPGEFVNADDVARTLKPNQPESASLAAGRLVVGRLDALIETRQSFVYETTLASHQAINLMRRTRAANYRLHLIFALLRHPDLNVERVRLRVAAGGHNIPEHAIRRRYEASLNQLSEAMKTAHTSEIYDNNAITGPRLLLRLVNGQIETSKLGDKDFLHNRLRRFAAEVAKSLAHGE